MYPDKIYLYVAKEEGGHILMGKPANYDMENDLTTIKDVLKISLVPTERGMVPFPSYYPNAYVGSFAKKSFLDELTVTITESDYVVIEEDNINSDLIDLYRKEIGKRSGIELVTSMPNISNIRSINK